MTLLSRRPAFLLVLGTLAAALVPAASTHAANYYLHANQSTTTWSTAADWFDDPTAGTGGNAVTNGNHYYSNGFSLRTSSEGSDASFGGAASTAVLHLNSQVNLRRGGALAVNNLNTYSGTPRISAANSPVTLTVATLANDANTIIDGGGTSGRTLNLKVTTLTGSGNLQLSNAINFNLTATTATAFTGNITWSDASVLNFDNPVDTPFVTKAGLALTGSAKISLDQDIKVGGLSLGGAPLGPGTYTFDYLNANYDAFFVDGGSGSITVPEPAGIALATAMAVIGLRRRRRA